MNNTVSLDSVLDMTIQANKVSVDTSMFMANKPRFGLSSVRLREGYTGHPSLEQWAVAADLHWDVVSCQEQFTNKGVLYNTPDIVLVRGDNNTKLGTVSNSYRKVTPKDVLNFFSDLIEKYDFEILEAGYADAGRKIYVYAKSGVEWEVANGDRTLNNLLFMTSLDGSSSTVIQPFVESFYCMNQLPMAGRLFSPIKVNHSSVFNPAKVKLDLGIYGEATNKFADSLKAMAKKTVNNHEALSILYNLLKAKEDIREESTININKVVSLHDKFRGAGIAATEEGRKGTLWGVLSAVTEYTDHDMGRNDNTRWKSKTCGAGATLKAKAYQYINEICNEQVEIELVKLP